MLEKGFVFLEEVVPGITWDAKYATNDNLTGEPLDGYRVNRVVGTRELAEALKNAAAWFELRGYGVHVLDAYRPQSAVDSFARWAARPENGKTRAAHYPRLEKSQLFPLGYIAAKSGHSRGSSIDLTLTRDGKEVDMGGIFDLMDDRSHHSYPIGSPAAENRRLLRSGMEANGFRSLEEEWWHYNLAKEPYPDTYFGFPIE